MTRRSLPSWGRPVRRVGAWCAPSSTTRSGPFAARAITRNVESEKAQELARLGAEVVADIDDTREPEPRSRAPSLSS